MHNGIERDPYFGTGRDREAGETQFPSWVEIVWKMSSPNPHGKNATLTHLLSHLQTQDTQTRQ